jgi:hypothetical protein
MNASGGPKAVEKTGKNRPWKSLRKNRSAIPTFPQLQQQQTPT